MASSESGMQGQVVVGASRPLGIASIGAVMLLVTLISAVTAGCASDQPAAGPTPTPSSTTRPQEQTTPVDRGLRPVKMIYGDGIGFVLSETAAQLICGALTRQEWRTVLGMEVSRTVYGSAVIGTCRVKAGPLELDLGMERNQLSDVGSTPERIAEHTVQFFPSSSDHVAAAVAAVLPIGEQSLDAQQRLGAQPILHTSAKVTFGESAPDLSGALRRVLATLLPRLTNAGPTTPAAAIPHELAYVPTDPAPGVALYDLPRSVQSMVLCTAVEKVSGGPPPGNKPRVDSVGECYIGGPAPVYAEVDPYYEPPPNPKEPFTIDGYPAQIVPDVGVVVDLRELTSEYNSVDHITLRLNNHAHDPVQLRAWAEKVADLALSA